MSDDADSSNAVPPRVQAALDDHYYQSGLEAWSAPLSVAAAGVLLVALSWHGLAGAWPLVWLAGTCLVAAAMFCANTVPRLRRPVDDRGLAYSAIACAVGTGSAFGAAMWIPEAATDPEIRLIVLCIQLAVSAGSVGGLSGIAGVGRYVVVPMWCLASSALFLHGVFDWGAALLFFMTVQIRDLTNTGESLFELVSAQEHIRIQAERAQVDALHDPLTGLPNRAGLEAAVASLSVGSAAPTVMYVDLDHFKSVNDRFGHGGGDEVLCEVADRLRARLRSSDVVARLGGDEFLLLLPEPLSADAQDRLAGELIDALELPFHIEGAEARISASIGITTVSASDFDLAAVQQEADEALYLAKGQGRRRSVRFDDSVRLMREERAELESSLRRGIADGEIQAWAQPLTELATGRVVGLELLARWQRFDGSWCPPSVFVPIAEEIGLIGDLGNRMLERGGAALHQLRAHAPEVMITVNMSPRQLVDETIIEHFEEVMAAYRPSPGSLVLELTETADLHAEPGMVDKLIQLVDRGAALALDDFGSGYSSVGHLLELPLQYVKIEGSLVAGLDGRPEHRALVRSVCELAGAMDRRVVVEGVETEQQAETLGGLGVALAQGYLWGRPRPLDDWIADLTDEDMRMATVAGRSQPDPHTEPLSADDT
ncbi:MAG: putative bifunctional diguanylate cyclase/phosphodiesterase [Acidimicrobiales bacterium]